MNPEQHLHILLIECDREHQTLKTLWELWFVCGVINKVCWILDLTMKSSDSGFPNSQLCTFERIYKLQSPYF
jgi:hypothetical protein